jgi:hypothetical protein
MRYAIAEPIENTGAHTLLKLNLCKDTATRLAAKLQSIFPKKDIRVIEDSAFANDGDSFPLSIDEKDYEIFDALVEEVSAQLRG